MAAVAAPAAPPPIVGEQPRASGRGRPDVVTIRRTTLMAGLLEGMSIAQDAIRVAERIQTLAAAGSRQEIAHEAGRHGFHGTTAFAELRRMAADVEEPL